jgi:hypothetical protein
MATIKIDLELDFLYWEDPDPIEGNDYRVTNLKCLGDGFYFIEYNEGQSEAEVPASELKVL